jgi:hypothetical protein
MQNSPPVWAASVRTSLPVVASHTLRFLWSKSLPTIRLPSGLKGVLASSVIQPGTRRVSLPVVASQSVIQFSHGVLPVMLADLVDGDDVRMIEVGRRLGLSVEALDFRFAGELAGQDHLEGDDSIEADLPGAIDDAHAAAGDLLEQLIVAEVADLGARRRDG